MDYENIKRMIYTTNLVKVVHRATRKVTKTKRACVSVENRDSSGGISAGDDNVHYLNTEVLINALI